MLNDLQWLSPGKPFPPEGERKRLERYAQNKRIFDNEHNEVYSQQIERIQRVIGQYEDWVAFPITLNYQKKISLKTADFLFIEPPEYTSTKGEDETDANNDKQQEVIEQICKNSNVNNKGYQGAIDCSMYGDTVLKIDIVNKKGIINISSPQYLFTVVDPDDRKKIIYYVLAWLWEKQNAAAGTVETYLTAFIHDKGKYTKRVYRVKNGKISNLVEEKKDVKTGLSDFAIVTISNLVTSDSVYGIDDYQDVDSIICELEIRTAQISKILDAHSNPTMSGPLEGMKQNKNGEWTFTPGDYYPRNTKESAQYEYMIWDASLDANFKQIELLLQQLSVMSEMGAVIFGGDLKAGNIPSGSAMKRLYINALAKVARLRNSFDDGLKKCIALASEIGYDMKLTVEDITITWQDGLPEDPKETAEIITARVGGQSLSIQRALKRYDGMSEADAEEEAQRIIDEQAAVLGGMTGVPQNTEE